MNLSLELFMALLTRNVPFPQQISIQVDSSYLFNNLPTSPFKRFPEYMYDNNRLNDIKYLLGFDTWMKFIPFNIFVVITIRFIPCKIPIYAHYCAVCIKCK